VRTLNEIARIALNLLLELLGLIFTPELKLLDLPLLLPSRLVEELALRLQLELTAQLAVVQLLPISSTRGHSAIANASLGTTRRYLVQLRPDERVRNRRKRHKRILPGGPPSVVETDMKLCALLLALQKVPVDAVIRTALRHRNPTTRSEQDRTRET
jgi:hypothetical protein